MKRRKKADRVVDVQTYYLGTQRGAPSIDLMSAAQQKILIYAICRSHGAVPGDLVLVELPPNCYVDVNYKVGL